MHGAYPSLTSRPITTYRPAAVGPVPRGAVAVERTDEPCACERQPSYPPRDAFVLEHLDSALCPYFHVPPRRSADVSELVAIGDRLEHDICCMAAPQQHFSISRERRQNGGIGVKQGSLFLQKPRRGNDVWMRNGRCWPRPRRRPNERRIAENEHPDYNARPPLPLRVGVQAGRDKKIERGIGHH